MPNERMQSGEDVGRAQAVQPPGTAPVLSAPTRPTQKPTKRRRIVSSSKGGPSPASDITNPPPPTLKASNQGISTGAATYAAVTAGSAGQPRSPNNLDALIRAKIDARAQMAQSPAQTHSASKDRMDAIIREKIKARASMLRSPSLASPATPASSSPNASSGHHRPPRLLGSPRSGGIEHASPGISGQAEGVAGSNGPTAPAKRSKRRRGTEGISDQSRQSCDVGTLQGLRGPQTHQLNARSSDKADAPPPQVSSSVPTGAWPSSGSNPADDLSARIEAKIRARAEKAEHHRLSLEASKQVTTPPAPAADALTAKINAKIQARAREQAVRQGQAIQAGVQARQTSIMESGSSVARRVASGTTSGLERPSASVPVPTGARVAKTTTAKAKEPKPRTSRTKVVKHSAVSARAPPSGPLGLEGLAAGPRRSRDAGSVAPHMAPPVSPGSASGPGVFRRSLILSDSESSDSSSPLSPSRQHSQQSQLQQVSRTSSASVSDILASSPVRRAVGPSSPPSEMSFMMPSSPPPATEAAAEEAHSPRVEIAAATSTAQQRSQWMHRSPMLAQRAATVTGRGVSTTPQLVRTGPRWTVKTPSQQSAPV